VSQSDHKKIARRFLYGSQSAVSIDRLAGAGLSQNGNARGWVCLAVLQ
jgi:hypothetical protein